MRYFLLAAGALVALSLGAAARAETVVLADGSSLEGQVSTLNGRVTIETADATLTLPAEKVLRVGTASAAAPAAAVAPKAPQTPAPAAAPAAPSRPSGPAPLSRAMAQKIDVAFDAVAPSEAFDYLRQVTNINLVVDNDVRADTRPLTLTLHDVSLASVLDLVKEMTGYTYEMRPGQILFVRGQAAPGAYVARMYDVRDLLVSTEDTGTGALGQGGNGQGTFGTGGGLTTRGSTTGGRGNQGQGLSPQFTPAPGVSPTVSRVGASATGSGPAAGTLTARAQDLGVLITSTCGQGSWAQPAVLVP